VLGCIATVSKIDFNFCLFVFGRLCTSPFPSHMEKLQKEGKVQQRSRRQRVNRACIIQAAPSCFAARPRILAPRAQVGSTALDACTLYQPAAHVCAACWRLACSTHELWCACIAIEINCLQIDSTSTAQSMVCFILSTPLVEKLQSNQECSLCLL